MRPDIGAPLRLEIGEEYAESKITAVQADGDLRSRARGDPVLGPHEGNEIAESSGLILVLASKALAACLDVPRAPIAE